MDLATLIGLVGGIGALIGAIMMESAEIVGSGYCNYPGMVIIGVGSICATMMAFSMKEVTNAGALLGLIFFHKVEDLGEIIEKIISFAQKARREGLLALEADLESIHDPFFRKGLQLVVDGVDPELIVAVLETDIGKMKGRHKAGEKFFMTMGGFAPTMGILGAIMGLTGALAKMGEGDIMTTVHSLAIAFIASFYGVGLANLVLVPIAGKLKFLSEEEVFAKELIVIGVTSIQGGDNPRIIEEKLKAFFSAKGYPLKGKEK